MSKIPEGTQFIEAGCGEKGFRKFEKGCWWFYEGFWRNVDWKMGALTLVSEHPGYTAPVTAWTGEGLPPVRTVCEIHLNKSVTHQDAVDWSRYAGHDGKTVKIVAHHEIEGVTTAVYALLVDYSYEYHSLVEGNFRPARTPEQIEAQEIQDIEIWLDTNIEELGSIARTLHESGFRKPEDK